VSLIITSKYPLIRPSALLPKEKESSPLPKEKEKITAPQGEGK